MNVAYIGYYNEGSTARMRGEYLREILPDATFKIINLDIPLRQTCKLFRSVGWRYKIGPLISNIAAYIEDQLRNDFTYDLVWVDKGVFVKPGIIRKLRMNSQKLVHFSPDPAFTYHRSRLFYQALPYYDFCITTKSFEVEEYRRHGVKTIFCTQGFDPAVHKPYFSSREKKGVVFIGHKEEEREEVLSRLVEAGIHVTLAGINWKRFASRYRKYRSLDYLGEGVFAVEYAKTISKAQIGLGLLSKWIPEKHTTRTFEIPACGTALVTENNADTSLFFAEGEAIFFEEHDRLPEIINYYMRQPDLLEKISQSGYHAVISRGFDYKNILKRILEQIHV